MASTTAKQVLEWCVPRKTHSTEVRRLTLALLCRSKRIHHSYEQNHSYDLRRRRRCRLHKRSLLGFPSGHALSFVNFAHFLDFTFWIRNSPTPIERASAKILLNPRIKTTRARQ